MVAGRTVQRDMLDPLVSSCLIVFHSLIFVASISVNTIIIVLFFQRRQDIRGVLDRFSLSLTLSNLLCVVLATPLILLHLSSADADRSLVLIKSADVALTMLMCSSVINQLLIACNRLVGVAHALRYRNLMTTTRGRLLVALAWLVAIGTTVLVSLAVHWPGKHTRWRLAGNLALFTLVFILPLLALTVIYGRIYVLARISGRRKRRHIMTLMSVHNQSLPTLAKSISTPDTPSMVKAAQHWQCDSSETRSVHSKHTESRGSLRSECASISRHKEQRTVRVSVAVVILFIISWLPLAAAELLPLPALPEIVHVLSAATALASTLATPFLYVLISRCVRRRIKRMLRMTTSPHRQSKTRSSLMASIKPVKMAFNGTNRTFLEVFSHKYAIKDEKGKLDHQQNDKLLFVYTSSKCEPLDFRSERSGRPYSWPDFSRSISEISCYTTTSDC
nr:tyramine receptor-like protein [Parasacculina yatsui]